MTPYFKLYKLEYISNYIKLAKFLYQDAVDEKFSKTAVLRSPEVPIGKNSERRSEIFVNVKSANIYQNNAFDERFPTKSASKS